MTLVYAVGEFVTVLATTVRITLPISTPGRFATSIFEDG